MQRKDNSTGYIETLKQTSLFAGIDAEDIEALLGCLDTGVKVYEKNAMVLWEGDTVSNIGVVLSGRGRSVKEDASGKAVIITLLEQGSLIGVLLAAGRGRASPVSVQATERLTVLFISLDSILKRCARLCPRHDRLLRNVLDAVAEKALILHDRNDCLIKPTIREKVLAYLVREAKEQKSRTFSVRLDRAAMAEYLNVDRSALSRELSRMKKDGLLDFYRNHFRLL